ncbi:MAG: 1-acyl-sn-glycerol-3-phosphate acyltransferase [Bacteroidales bacterium]|nr:1-acyl-sn-glycerol-3-phosphate acyltransferase [Bacteroidales bacterium]MCB9000166.1 1-acyl-sn-glycerol-3-phosphate acyltransferase [Bacteroidales bacterium]MCB9012709.1 1-acyl-sn-glycerol-3-phosphate acyltransferase [Bacteroidales bacterium]
MIKTAFFFFIFWIGLMISLILLLIFYIISLSGFKKAAKKYAHLITSRWARFTLFTAGIKVDVSGLENIPLNESGFVIVSNHQGNFDIPVYISCLPVSPGFIAKKELMKLPFLSNWMKVIDCLPIDRKNARNSRQLITERIKEKDKNPIFLFPEGTRSQGREMGPFRTGTLKMLFLDRVKFLPATINNSYSCFEKSGHVTGARVSVDYHPMLNSNKFSEKEFGLFEDELKRIIQLGLEKHV